MVDSILKKLYHITMFKTTKILALGAIFVLAWLWFFTIWRWRLSPDFIPLHYTVYFGFDRFGPKYDIFLFPTLGTVVLALNAAVSARLFHRNGLWQGLWWGVTLLLQIILFLSLLLVVFKSL